MPEQLLVTSHRYIEKYPIDRNAKKLILGTIHPHFHKEFEMDFFYGNELSIWRILHENFPTELRDPSSVVDVINFLKQRQIAISDTVLKCERLSPTALDKDLKILKYNSERLVRDIANSSINEILCTSGFDKNNAFRIFYCEILNLRLTTEIRQNKIVELPSSIFGRPVRVRAIYSPSPSANRGIGKSKGYKAVKHLMSTDQYRVKLYSQYFGQ